MFCSHAECKCSRTGYIALLNPPLPYSIRRCRTEAAREYAAAEVLLAEEVRGWVPGQVSSETASRVLAADGGGGVVVCKPCVCKP